MATTFPTSLDTPLTNPTSTSPQSSPPHDVQHTQANDSIAALEAKVGVNNSTVTSSLDYRLGLMPGRNRLMNGNHVVRQRGNGTFTTSAYGIDGTTYFSTGSTFVASAQAHPVAAIPGVKESGYFHRVIVTSAAGASNLANTRYAVEGVETLAGQVCTLSWYAKADAARPIATEVVQSFGTGGAPSADVTAIGVYKPTLSTSWARYTTTFTMPSITGKTLGSNGNSSVSINFWFDAGSTYNARTSTLGQQSGTFDIDMVQLEVGANATPFEFENPALTLAKCQRYFQTSYQNVAIPTNTSGGYLFAPVGSATLTNGFLIGHVIFRQPMRATPTIQTYSYTSSTTGVVSSASGTDLTANSGVVNTVQPSGFILYNNSGAAITPNFGGFIFHWTASAEL